MSVKAYNNIQENGAMDEKEDFYKLADKINNALFAIIGNAELIRLKASSSENIDGQVTSILRLIRKISDFTSQFQGKYLKSL
jgi:hypothetical protein